MIDKSYRPGVIPKYFYNRITDITPEDLTAMGAKGVAVDVDNTTAYDSTYKLLDGVEDWVKNTVAAGFPVMIISNTYMSRAKYMSKKLGNIPYIGNSGKPDKKSFLRGAEMLGIKVSELAMIGDQLFTDIYGANDAGAISVRVRYAKREIVMGLRYRMLRKKENMCLIKAGCGDKI